MQRQSISRKRNFAQRLSQLDGDDPAVKVPKEIESPPSSKRFALSTPPSSSATPISATPISETPISATPIKATPVNAVKTPSVVEPEHSEPLVDGEVFEDYVINGVGKSVRAIHKKTDTVFIATSYNAREAAKIMKIIFRVESAQDYYHGADCEDLSNRIVPKETEFMKVNDDKYVLFVPAIDESVHTFASERCERITEREVFDIFYQLARVVKFCHAIGLIIRDMKPRRMLLKQVNGEYKLCINSIQDFIILDDPNNDLCKERFVSPAFVPPELLLPERKNKMYSGKASDVWGMGVLLYMLIIGRFPFYDKTPSGVFRKIRRANVIFPQILLSKGHTHLVCMLLQKFPEHRPTAEDIVRFKLPSSDNQCRSKAQASMGDLFTRLEYVTEIMNASTPLRGDPTEIVARRERLLRGPLRLQAQRIQQEISNQLRVDGHEIQSILNSKRAQAENRANWPLIVHKIAAQRLAVIKTLYKQEGTINTSDIRMLHLPNELLLPPEVYPPRDNFDLSKSSFWLKTYELLKKHDRLQFSSFKYNGEKYKFRTPITFKTPL